MTEPRGPRGPYAPSRDRVRAVLPILAAILVKGVASHAALARALAQRGVPPPKRHPWGYREAGRLLQAVERIRRASWKRQDLAACRTDLRASLQSLVCAETRLALLGEQTVWRAIVVRQRRKVAHILVAYPVLAVEADAFLREYGPQVREAELLLRRPLRLSDPLEWTLAAVLRRAAEASDAAPYPSIPVRRRAGARAEARIACL